MKLFIIGHGRHGKDTTAEFLRDTYGLTFQSSSMFCAEHVVSPWMKRRGFIYEDIKECYADRHNHRMEWYDAIRAYNKKDPARLSREIFESYDMYVGIRSRTEFLESKSLADLSIWVEAWDRAPEKDPSCKILRGDCDIIIDTNGTMRESRDKLVSLFNLIMPKITYENRAKFEWNGGV